MHKNDPLMVLFKCCMEEFDYMQSLDCNVSGKENYNNLNLLELSKTAGMI